MEKRRKRVNGEGSTGTDVTDAKKKRLEREIEKKGGERKRNKVKNEKKKKGGVKKKREDELVDGSVVNRLANAGRALVGQSA